MVLWGLGALLGKIMAHPTTPAKSRAGGYIGKPRPGHHASPLGEAEAGPGCEPADGGQDLGSDRAAGWLHRAMGKLSRPG